MFLPSSSPSRPLPVPVIVARGAGLLMVAVIGILSLVPGSARPHVAWPWSMEHATAYLAAAGLLSLGFLGTRMQRAGGNVAARALAIGGLLAVYGTVLEGLQYFVPGRTPSTVDWCANIVGTGLGISLALVLRSVMPAQHGAGWRLEEKPSRSRRSEAPRPRSTGR